MSVRPGPQKTAMTPPKYYIVGIMGKSGSRKELLLEMLRQEFANNNDVNFVVLDTTDDGRAAQLNKLSGEEITDKFLNDKYIEASFFHDHFYGTPKSEIKPNKINVGVWPPNNFSNLIDTIPNSVFVPLLLNVSDRNRWLNLLQYQDDIEKLYSEHREELFQFEFDKNFQPVILDSNNDKQLQTNFNMIKQLINNLARAMRAGEF